MNSEAECNCCPAVTCDASLPQSSATPFVSYSNRAERPLKYETECGRKNCRIFGSHDTNPVPEYSGYPKALKTKDDNKNSLGTPIGLVSSNVNFRSEVKTGDILKARYATYLKAFARLFLNDLEEWNSQLLDDIMNEGLDLYTKSQNRESQNAAETSDIFMPHEKEVLRQFQLAGFEFHVEIMLPLSTKDGNSLEPGAQGDGRAMTVENIIPALRRFLRQHKYGLLTVGVFYCMIWHNKDGYFVFDACGRRLTDFQTDRQKGVATLMCFKSLQNIKHLISHLSGLQITDPLILRELKLVKVITPQGRIMQVDYNLRQHQYEIVNDDYAFLKSDLHLTLNKNDLLRNRSGLAVAVTAMVVSKIEHPATWNQKILDHIICFGVNFYQAKSMKSKTNEFVEVSKFPSTFPMGQFHIHLEIKEHCYLGTWHCVPRFKHSELAQALKKAFLARHYKLLLQINYQVYAIWKKQDFIYLLDAYRHRLVGKQNEAKVYEDMEKSASVRMFREFEVFMNVLNHILLDSNRSSPFFLHFLKVRNIQAKEKPGQTKTIVEPKLDDRGEVISINEHICFEEAEDVCKVALGEISDYEDDDLKSDVDEIELRTSSSEEDLLEEEGEMAAGELGEMEDIETSSSGEEGIGHKRRQKMNKKPGKGGKGNKGKQTKKTDQNRNKKEAGANDSENEGELSDGKNRGKGRKDEKLNQNEEGEEGEGENDLKQVTKGGKHRKEKTKQTKGKFGKDSEKKAKGQDMNIKKDQEEDEDKNKDQDQDQSRDLNKEKYASNKQVENKSKGKNLLSDEDIINEDISKVKQFSSDIDQIKDSKNESQDLSTDKSKDTDLIKSLIQDKIKQETKSELDKKEQQEDTNKENEILEGFHKFTDDEDKAKDKENAKNPRKDAKDKSQKGGCKYNDGTEADDENEEEYLKVKRKKRHLCSIPNPNSYPGYVKSPVDMAIVGSESGSYKSICKLFQAAFKVADRLLLMTPWGNFVIFRCMGETTATQEKHYFLFDGCTCNFDRFRHFDLSVGTAGLICFKHLHNIIEYIRHLRKLRSNQPKQENYSADDICKEYCNKSFILRV